MSLAVHAAGRLRHQSVFCAGDRRLGDLREHARRKRAIAVSHSPAHDGTVTCHSPLLARLFFDRCHQLVSIRRVNRSCHVDHTLYVDPDQPDEAPDYCI